MPIDASEDIAKVVEFARLPEVSNSALRETAEEFGVTTFGPRDLDVPPRKFEKMTGTKVVAIRTIVRAFLGYWMQFTSISCL